MREMFRLIATACERIPVPPCNVQAYFDKLGKDPKSYAFSSHRGIFPEDTHFGQVGSQFITQEQFFPFLPFIKLRFRFIYVAENAFILQLVRTGIADTFVMFSMLPRQEGRATCLRTSIFSDSVFLPLLRDVLLRQLCAELDHISKSIVDRCKVECGSNEQPNNEG